MTAGPRDELADLRRRAYGPAAGLDEADLVRLQHLEDALRVDDAPQADEGKGDEPDAAATVAAAPEPPAPTEPLRATLRRRRVVLALLATALIAAVVAAVWLTTRPGETTLRRLAQNDTAAQQPLASSLRTYGLDPDSYVQFEPFEGLSIWTARIPDRGVRCLLIVDAESANVTFNGLVGWNCTPEGLVPTVDVTQFDTVDGAVLGSRPAGSVARFVFRGDRVEATVVDARAEPRIATPAPR